MELSAFNKTSESDVIPASSTEIHPVKSPNANSMFETLTGFYITKYNIIIYDFILRTF